MGENDRRKYFMINLHERMLPTPKGCLFVLRFYGPVNPMRSCRAQSVYLTTRSWTGLVLKAVNQYCAHSFARNWQLPFLNQWKGENDCGKYFMINLHERILLTSGRWGRWGGGGGVNLRPPGLQSDPTDPQRLRTEPTTSWSPVGCSSNWDPKASIKKFFSTEWKSSFRRMSKAL